jgi:Flp pilus assembly protein TadB
MSADQIRQRAVKFEKKIYWRNAREYVAAFVVVAFFAFELWRGPDPLTAAGFALIIAGVLYLVWHLHRRGSVRTPPADLGLTSGVEFFRRELERQRDLVKSVWRWYLGPVAPGLIVVMVAAARANPGHLRHFGWFMVAYDLFATFVFVFIWRLNERAARKLQRQIDELDALREPR